MLADTLVLDALADATIDSALPGLNQGNALELVAGWSEEAGEQSLRALLGFDLSPLPANAIVESAYLELERVDPGDDGVIARIEQPWIEDAVTWASQPTYAGPVALPAGGDPAQWDVTPLVIAAHMAQLPGYGFAVLETPGDAAAARYRSRESGAAARLIINYALDVPDEPQPPPIQSEPVFSVDPGLEPIAPAIGDIVADGVAYDRSLAALLMEADTPFSFVVGEVIFTPADAAELEVFLDAFGGIVLASPELPDPPPELAEQVRPVAPDGAWLIRIDPDLVDPAGINAAAAEFGLRGEQRVSSDAGLRTIALVLQASQAGLHLSLNLAGQLTQDFPPLELE
ncbi:MAG: DNRLRE domain-containing protein, partial [Gammaproteobacteria bacterium]|nr:DNRLRE domain-containing protein [Gammaproteobacteria bacterium]